MRKSSFLLLVLTLTVAMSSWAFSGPGAKGDKPIAPPAKSDAAKKAEIADQTALEQARLQAIELEAARKQQEISKIREKVAIGEPEKKEEADLKVTAAPEVIPEEVEEDTRGALPFAVNLAPRPALSISGRDDQPVILTEVLFEDFNNWGPYGDNPPAGWTIIDSGYVNPWDNNDWYKYYYSTWSSNVARVYYSPIENQDEWLISSAIDASTYSNLHLVFKSYLSSPDSSDVLGSTDGGSNWTTIARYTSSHSTTDWDYDISAWADGQASVIIAFRYMDYNGYYWMIDDIAVQEDDGINPVNVVFSEDFEGTWGPYGDNPPTGWTIIDNGDYDYSVSWDNNDWHKYYYSTWTDTVARIYYLPAERQNEWLISPAMDLSTGADQILLKFKHYYNDGGTTAEDTAWVLGTTDDWATVQTIAMYLEDQGSSSAPSYPELDITAWANNESNVKIAFKYVGESDYYWYVDSVTVETITLPAHDVMAVDFLAPGDIMIEGYDWDVSSRFKNVGTNTESFNAYYDFSHLLLTPFFSEGFDLGLPVTWTVIDSLNDGYTWMTGSQHDTQYPGEERSSSWWNGEYMIADADAPGSGVPDMSEELLSPWVNCSGQSGIYLYFTHYYYHSGTQFGDVDIRTSQGDSWTNLAHYDVTKEGEATIDISTYADGQDSVQIRWWFHTTGWTWYWGIDNVKLATGTVISDYLDLTAVSNLPSLGTADVVFDDFMDPDVGAYTITTYHNLAGDLDRSNDTLVSSSVCYPHFGTGGPDAGYYSWNDNINGGGPAFSWVDISGIGTPVTWDLGSIDNRYTSGIAMGMSFYFYGNTYSRIFLCENGQASFDSITTTSTSSNYGIPTTSGLENLIALMWDDLNGAAGTAYYYYDSGTNQFIVQFDSWDYDADLGQNIQMQFILDGDDASIKFQYNDVGPTVYASATVGIENADGDVGLEYVYSDDPLGNVTMPGLAITFTYDPLDHDVAAVEIVSPSDMTEAGDPFTPTTIVSNLGANTETFNVHFAIADSNGLNIYSDVAAVTGLAPLASDSVEFTLYTINVGGTYTCSTYTALGTDEYRDNDTLTSTIEVAQHYSQGGPDDHGYRYIDNWSDLSLEEPPVFDWIELSDGTGILIDPWDNGYSGDSYYTNLMNMGLTSGFEFYGTNYTSIMVSINGWLSFDSQTSSWHYPDTIPDPASPNNLVALIWSDLHLRSGGVYYYTDTANNRFIVQYHNVEFYSPSGSTIDAEVIFNGDDGTIIMQYLAFGPGKNDDISISIENSDGTIGLGYVESSGSAVPGRPILNLPVDSLAIKFYIEYYDHDVALTEFLSPTGMGSIGDPVIPEVKITNRGINDETNVPVHLEITPGIYSEIVYTNVDSGATANVIFPSFAPTSGGSYTLTAFSALATDEDNSNDTLQMTYYVYDAVIDFEANDGGLTATGDWEWGTPTTGPGSAYSGVNVWATKLDTDYTEGFHTLEFDLEIGTTDPVFGFAQWYDTEARFDGGNFAVSTDGGSSWIAVSPSRGYDDTCYIDPIEGDSIFTGHDQQFWEVVTFDLSAYADMIVDARLAFVADGSVFYPGWYVDDFIFINCQFFIADHDVAVTEFLAPSGSGVVDEPISPEVEVSNLGANDETNVPVHLEITPGIYSEIVYTNVDSGATANVIFPSFTPTSGGIYTLTAFSDLATDEDNSNDTLQMTYYVYDTVIDFEANDGGLTATGDWEWGTPTTGPGSAYSGVNVWATKLDTDYTQGLHTLEFDIEVGATNPVFGFAQWYYTEGDYTAYDGCNFAISEDGGATWIVISPDRGYDKVAGSANPLYPDSVFCGSGQQFWEGITFDLSAFAGTIVDARLALGADGSGFYPGWYVDDFGFIDCDMYYPRDVALVSIDEPTGLLSGDAVTLDTYDIKATVKNSYSSPLTFTVGAEDNYTYTGSATVTDLAPFATTQVTFSPGWTVLACSSYTLMVYTELGDIADDDDPSNDTLSADYEAISVYNEHVQYDDGVYDNAWRYARQDWVIANEFIVPYQGATISAIEFMLSDDTGTLGDTVRVCIYLDGDADGIPDTIPAYCDTILAFDDPEIAFWPIGCDTTITLNCESFWAGWIVDYSGINQKWLVIDDGNDYDMGWGMERAGDNPDSNWVWVKSDPFDGDNFIRAYFYGDPLTAPDIALGATEVSRQADLGECDTVSNSIENAAVAGCDLVYSVSIQQNVASAGVMANLLDAKFHVEPIDWVPINDKVKDSPAVSVNQEKPLQPVYPSMTLGSGGPDAFGYTWIDSDEPGGPTYSWVDISTSGTDVIWDTCDASYGCYDAGLSEAINIGMTFNYYGVDYTEVVVSSNGWVSFPPQDEWYNFEDPIPNTDDPNGILAVLWDDLDGEDGVSAGWVKYYRDDTENQLIISWINWGHWNESTTDINFQVIIDGDDNSILYQYGPGAGVQTDYCIGIENLDGTDGLQVAYDQAYATDNLAVVFYAPVFWLSTDLPDSTLSPGGLRAFDIFMDGTQLEAATYNGAIIINSNDPDESVSTIDVTFEVCDGGEIAGTVFDEDGTTPLADVVVEAYNSVPELVGSDITDAEGLYGFNVDPAGIYSLTFTKANYVDTSLTDLTTILCGTTQADMIMCIAGFAYLPGDVNMALGIWPPQCIGGDVTYLVGYFIGGGQAACMLDGFWASADINGDCTIIGGDVTALVGYFVAGGSLVPCPAYQPLWPPLPFEAPEGWPNCDTPVINSKLIPTGSVK